MKVCLLSFILLFHLTFELKAQNADSNANCSKLHFQLCLIDLPYYLDAVEAYNEKLAIYPALSFATCPSMNQSLVLTTSLYSGIHYGITKLYKADCNRPMSFFSRIFYGLTILSSDIILLTTPGFSGWLHEEFHRAVMTRFHVSSLNEMNYFPLFANSVSVSHVTDENLIRFKKESFADFNRMHVAGIEGEYLLVDQLQRNNFFFNHNLPHESACLFSTFNSISYVRACAQPDFADPETDSYNAVENLIEDRDFTGLDFLGWAYDLFRPDEPYENRGTHISGNGIDRYRKTTHLLPEELDYLWVQGNLQWLNLISPMLFGYRRIAFPALGIYTNFALHHYLTSFGNDISLTLFVKRKDLNLIVTAHSYQNYLRSFPAIEAAVVQYPLNKFLISARSLIGFQPENQIFKTTNSSFAGLFDCRILLKGKYNVNPYAEMCIKTNGWVAGNEFISKNFSIRAGLDIKFKY